LCQKTDEVALAALAAEHPLAIIGDSTNVGFDGDGLFERDLTPHLAKIFADSTGRVVLTCIASNIPRWLNVLEAAKKAGRQVGLVGRSLWRHHEAAVKCGFLTGHEFLSAEAISSLPANRTVAIATGSQGDRGSAMDRLSFGEHNLLKLHKNDTVLFSARVIPGAEKAIMRMQNSLVRQNIRVITPDHATIHVSGHAYKNEVKKLYALVQPKACIPVHGYLEGMQDHVDIAESCGVKHGIVPHNGDVISIGADGALQKIAEVPHGILAIDGTVFIRLDQATQLKERRKLAEDGSVMATILVDSYGLPIQDPMISFTGLMSDPKAQAKLCQKIAEKIGDALDQMGEEKDLSDDVIKEQAHLMIRQHVRQALEKKPMVIIHVVRVAD
jgi:ribonuclease J